MEELRRLVDTRATALDIAIAMDLSEEQVRYGLRLHGLRTRPIRTGHEGRPHRWDPATVATIYERRLNGETLADIGAEYGVTRERIRQVLNQHGYSTFPTRKMMVNQTRDCVLCGASYRRGEYKEHIAEAGHLYSRGGHRPTDRMWDDYVVEAYRRGDRIVDISRACGWEAYPQIYRILRRNGVPLDRGGGRYERTPLIRQRIRAGAARRRAGIPKPANPGWRPPR